MFGRGATSTSTSTSAGWWTRLSLLGERLPFPGDLSAKHSEDSLVAFHPISACSKPMDGAPVCLPDPHRLCRSLVSAPCADDGRRGTQAEGPLRVSRRAGASTTRAIRTAVLLSTPAIGGCPGLKTRARMLMTIGYLFLSPSVSPSPFSLSLSSCQSVCLSLAVCAAGAEVTDQSALSDPPPLSLSLTPPAPPLFLSLSLSLSLSLFPPSSPRPAPLRPSCPPMWFAVRARFTCSASSARTRGRGMA